MNRKYFAMSQIGQKATINIYGDITSWPWMEGDVSAVNLSKQLEELADVTEIEVFINSYGGEVAEGLAIYNALKRHKARVKTIVDGFACSIASVIFMAGDERIMNDASLLMIHNAWTWAEGNAAELRKQADDLDKITQASINAYKAHSTLSEEAIKELLDNESWILPEEALEYGFATAIEKTVTAQAKASQSAKMRLQGIIKNAREESAEGDEEEDTPDDDETPDDDNPADDDPNADDADDAGDDPDAEDAEGEEDENSEDDPEDETEKDNAEKEAAQKWSGFFNALLKM